MPDSPPQRFALADPLSAEEPNARIAREANGGAVIAPKQ
jgi:hypothetical protein